MKIRFIVVTGALAVVACGNSENKPPRDPTTETTAGASYAERANRPTTTTTTTTRAEYTDAARSGVTSSSGDADRAGVTTTGVAPAGNNGSNTVGANEVTAPVIGANSGTMRGADQTGTVRPTGAADVTNRNVSADHTKDADNTKVNERDRPNNGARAATPTDQGNSAEETKITAAIRRELVADKTLSLTAKNVKVITTGTKVTLRGPVKTDAEKNTVEAVAKRTSGVSEVDNLLEVKK